MFSKRLAMLEGADIMGSTGIDGQMFPSRLKPKCKELCSSITKSTSHSTLRIGHDKAVALRHHSNYFPFGITSGWMRQSAPIAWVSNLSWISDRYIMENRLQVTDIVLPCLSIQFSR